MSDSTPNKDALAHFVKGTPFIMLSGTSDTDLTRKLLDWKPAVDGTQNDQDYKRLDVISPNHPIVSLFSDPNGIPKVVQQLRIAINAVTTFTSVSLDIFRLGNQSIKGEPENEPLPTWLILTVPPGTYDACGWDKGCKVASACYDVLKASVVDDVHCLLLEGKESRAIPR